MKKVLPVIVVSQFFCTSLWFAGNAVAADIGRIYQLDEHFVGHLTSAIQLGFIAGTLCFALLAIADRFSPSKVFLVSALLAALFNLGLTLPGLPPAGLLAFRFATGFFLAGIYPVGMKIAADHFAGRLSHSLGFLVGALVLGTAFPHLLKNFTHALPWRWVLFATSSLSVAGGLAIGKLVPDGPHRSQGQRISLGAFVKGFSDPGFRAVSFGYFGHMWELYTFWAFVPVMLAAYNSQYPTAVLNVPLWSFLLIASGSLACVAGGFLSRSRGPKPIATIAIALSGICCLLSPFLLMTPQPWLMLSFLGLWSMVVIADSPLFSSLVAHHAPAAVRGSSLTIVNCIGFSITIVSIQFLNALMHHIPFQYLFLLLAPGPAFGLYAMLRRPRNHTTRIDV